MSKEPLWKPDKFGEFHLGDLMYAIEKQKQLEKENSKNKMKGEKNDGIKNDKS